MNKKMIGKFFVLFLPYFISWRLDLNLTEKLIDINLSPLSEK